MVRRFVTDERLLRVFTFQALYAGVPPHRALAVYAVIAYMDTVAGVYFPRGGMRALPDALAAAASDAGVEFHYSSAVSALDRINGRVDRACARILVIGFRRDAVVLTTELPDTYRLLGRTPRRLLALRPAPSAVVAHVGCRASGSDIGHHTIVFGDAWEQTFRDIIDDGRLMGDPSLLVTRPTAGDPGSRRQVAICSMSWHRHRILLSANVDWGAIGAAYTERMLETVTRRLPQLGVDADVLHVVDPAGWARQGMAAGTPFALAHTFGQTGPFRPANTVRGIDNVVLAGSSTVPGVGVPTALLSGRLAADRITGVANRRRSRHRWCRR